MKKTLGMIALLAFQNSFMFAKAEEQIEPSIDAFAVLPAIQSIVTSPDGEHIAMVRATSKNGDYIVEIHKTDELNKDPVKLSAGRMEITSATWLNNERIGVNFRQNIQDGNRNYWATKFAIIDADGKGGWLEPFKNDKYASFSMISLLPQDDKHILLEYDANNNYIPDVVKMNVNTGKYTLVMRGNSKVQGSFVSDFKGDIRGAVGYDATNNTIDFYARHKEGEDWNIVHSFVPEERETFNFLGFAKDNVKHAYVNATNGKDKAAIYLFDIEKKQFIEQLFGLEDVDAGSIMYGRTDKNFGKLIGFTYTTKNQGYYFVDPQEEQLFNAVQSVFKDSHVTYASRSHNNETVIVRVTSDNDSGSYHLLRNKKSLVRLGDIHPLVTPELVSKVKYIPYKARDGMTIPSYITIPTKGKKPYPAVVMPHGGPWARDTGGYDEWSQLLAHHGYLVIQPQFRGSEGFGQKLWKAGDKQWGLTMQDDLEDGLQFLVDKGFADKDKLAIFGWSYGGYAAFAASMRENNIFQCSIAGAGVSDIKRISSVLSGNRISRVMQKPTIKGVSPYDTVEKVNIPLLVIHGDIDQRVPIEHSRLFVEELVKYNKDHKYVELKGADHFSNTIDYNNKKIFYSNIIDWLDNKCFN